MTMTARQVLTGAVFAILAFLIGVVATGSLLIAVIVACAVAIIATR